MNGAKLLLVFFLFIIPLASAGQYKINGIVRDSVTQEMLTGVVVVIKKENKGAVTNTDGKFEIETFDLEPELIFSYSGWKTKIILVPVNGQAIIDMNPDAKSTGKKQRKKKP